MQSQNYSKNGVIMQIGSGTAVKRWLTAGVLAAGLVLASGAQAIPAISVGSATVNAGDTFTISVSISGATDLQAFQFDLSYGSAVLSVLGITDVGTAFDAAASADGGGLTGITGFSFAGLLSGVGDSMSGVSPGGGLGPGGVLVNIDFYADAPGTSALTLSSVFLNFLDSGFDTHDGAVCVRANPQDCPGGSPVPVPGTLWLLLPALAALRLRWPSARHVSQTTRD